MDDDRLASELERRSRAALPRPDWARHDLLPAVRREIDARPQPVVTSRWSPRLGVAAVVAALLIMVVAVPRLVPAPPTSSSSPTQSATLPPAQTGVLSTAEFASRLAAGELSGETVLVDGRIGPNLDRVICTPSGSDLDTCWMGPLEGTDPQIHVKARWLETNAEDRTTTGLRWDKWHFPFTPQEGFLLLTVDDSRQVEFVGLARDSGPGPVWSVADADGQHLDINTVGADEVILVRGWLVETEPPGTTINIDCMAPQFSRVDGLPYNYCLPQDYLSSEQPVDELTPRGTARLSVQRNAAQLFGARIQDGTSLFAIAPRLYGGCFDAPTCWQWDIVARVDQRFWEPLPSRAPTHTFDCGLAPLQVIDETGLVEACAGSQLLGDGNPVIVSNPDGDPGFLEISWGSVPACGDGPESVTLRPRATGYELLVVHTRTDSACDGVVYETRIVLRLSEPIPADTVIVSLSSSEPSPSPIECQGVGLPISVSDPTGLVVGCSEMETGDIADLGPDLPVIENRDGDRSRLRIAWRTSGCATSASVSVTPNSNPPLFLISAPPSCTLASAIVLGIELSLSSLVDANLAGVRFHEPGPTPLTDPQSIDCGPVASGDPKVTVYDETGLIESCEASDSDPASLAGVRVLNPDGNLAVLQIDWTGYFGCQPSAVFTLSGSAPTYRLSGEIPSFGACRLLLVSHSIQLSLRADLDAELVQIGDFARPDLPNPIPTPSPAPTDFGSRTFICAGSEALGDPGITLVDHSGRIGACSMARADLIPEEPIEVTTTRLPGQLAVDWNVNTGCPGDERMEFWGPVEEPIGPADYVLQVAHRTLGGEVCNDLGTVRRVELGFTELVRPADIQAFVTRESVAEDTTSNAAGVGSFDLLLAAPLGGVPANEPIDITASLTYKGSDPVTLSGSWRPDFSFVSLAGGPSLHTYGSILLCPDAEAQLSPGDSIVGQLEHPQPQVSGDPNNAYYDEYAYDGQFRLPAGTYLIFTGVAFNVGSQCSGDRVALRTAIVIRVGGFFQSGGITHTAPP